MTSAYTTCFFCNVEATTEVYTYGQSLALEDALPVCGWERTSARITGSAARPGRSASAPWVVTQVAHGSSPRVGGGATVGDTSDRPEVEGQPLWTRRSRPQLGAIRAYGEVIPLQRRRWQ